MTKESYEWVLPDTEFEYHGMPLPERDKANVNGPLTKEDVAYLVEWTSDLRAGLCYAKDISAITDPMKAFKDNGVAYWDSQRTSRMMLAKIDDCVKCFFYPVSATSNAQYTCAFTADSFDSIMDSMQEPQIRQNTSYSTWDEKYCVDTVIPESTRCGFTPVSSVICPSGGYPSTMTSYYANLPITLPYLADGVRKLYYDLDKIRYVAKYNTYTQNGDGSYVPGSIDYAIDKRGWWNTNSYASPIAGNLSRGTGITKTETTYTSGAVKKTTTTTVTYKMSDGYQPYGSDAIAVHAAGQWTDISRWKEQKRGYSQSKWFYKCAGQPHYLIAPAMKGKIDRLAVLHDCSVQWQSSYGGSYDYNTYFHILVELTKDADYREYEVWKDTSGWSTDSDSLQERMATMLKSKFGDVYQFTWSLQNVAVYIMELKDSKGLHLGGWNWSP